MLSRRKNWQPKPSGRIRLIKSNFSHSIITHRKGSFTQIILIQLSVKWFIMISLREITAL
jgi:hypothetical protein